MDNLISERSVKILEFTYSSPIFKGVGMIIVGGLALLYAYYMVKRWNEPKTLSFKVFIGLAVFVVLYGLFVLIVRPQWWLPMWWK